MKKLFLSFLALMIVAAGYAQSMMVATLSHEGTISAYYGTSAFKKALADAVDGDAITLSSGRFDAADITKAVSIRGAGVATNSDSLNAHGQTLIYGVTNINIADSLSANALYMEGIFFNDSINYSGYLNNAQFQKCRFDSWTRNGGTMNGASFLNCRICKWINLRNGNATFINSIVCNPYNDGDNASTIEFVNCFIKFTGSNYNGITIPMISYSSYTNCFMHVPSDYNKDYKIPNSCVAYNCIGFFRGDYVYEIFSEMTGNTTNKYLRQQTDFRVFKTYDDYYSSYIEDDNSFELTDSIATTYLGTDGTQVGVYGGSFPYDEEPTTPKITKLTVSPKTDADNRLYINLSVKAAE